jgi:uncharacterized protein YxjI
VQFFLKPESGAEVLFLVWDSRGQPVYRVVGEFNPFGCRCFLRDEEKKNAARMTGVYLPFSFRCSISAGGRRLRMTVKPSAPHRAVQFKGVCWRFRGSILTRSFDIVEELDARGKGRRRTQVVMTHGRCWNKRADCYALEIPRAADVPLAVCVAAAIDSAVLSGCAAPVPAE